MASSRPDILRGFRNSLNAARAGFSWLREKIGVVITVLVALCGVTLVASGIPLIWQYEPAGSTLLQSLHEGAGYILIILTLILAPRALIARVRRRRRQRPSHLGPVAATGLLVLTLAAGTTGVAIAWDQIHTPSHVIVGDSGTGETLTVALPPEAVEQGAPVALPPDAVEQGAPVVVPERDSGIVAATQDGVVNIVSDGAPVPPEEYIVLSWFHLAIFPALAAATYAGGRWLHIRRQKTDTPDGDDAAGTTAPEDKGSARNGGAATDESGSTSAPSSDGSDSREKTTS